MAQLHLIENNWVEKYQPTMDEYFILRGEDSPEKEILINKIKTLTPAKPSDILIANQLFDANKIDESSLISCIIDTKEKTGLINCRVNEEHKQIRF